uniref:Uncharacterized protein n=1 Tax=Glossina pallidipes TaxID=7398 RepID=A0A1B0AJA8_GLOPL
MVAGTSSLIAANSSIAALAAAAATLGSTTEAKNATVDINGFPDLLKGIADEENSCVLLLSLVFPVCEFSPSQVDKVDNACAALPPVISSSKSVIVPPSMVTKVSILM